jgi:hypothetical protein
MIREVIERFTYRFELWRREQREDYFRPIPSAGDSEEPDYVSHFAKHPELVTESTFLSIGRRTAFFGIISLVAYVCFWVCRFFPALRFAVGVVFVVFCGLWTLGAVFFEIDLWRARKQYREREAKKSSNQAMQLTAGRSESHVSIHESAFRPAMPRPRQR